MLAALQHGVVIRQQLLDLGMSPGAVKRRVRSGWLRPVHRGVFVVGAIAPARALDMAAVLVNGRTALLSHRSGAALRGLIAPGPDGADIDVTVTTDIRTVRAGIRLWRASVLDPDERSIVDRIPVTITARTLIDLACVVDERQLERAVARAERERLISSDELVTLPDRYSRRPGVRRLRAVLDVAGGPAFTRSEGEQRFLALLREAGLPEPRTNFRVAGYEVDFYWPAERLAVEFDGWWYHGTRPRFELDREQSLDLAARGTQVLSITHRQVDRRPIATAAQVAQALAHAHLRNSPRTDVAEHA
jgi:very-short-patch-repair endonuclease